MKAPKAVSNTSPLVYLFRIEGLEWLAELFESVWVPSAVVDELLTGRRRGYHVPDPAEYPWLKVVAPSYVPPEWFSLDLGRGEIAAMALALDNSEAVLLIDDALARRVAEAAGLSVWGTLRVLLVAKERRLVPAVLPYVERLQANGMWMSAVIKRRILGLAGE